MDNYFGNYRAKVIENEDEDNNGKIEVWPPDILPYQETHTIIARPANNPVGSRNDENPFIGTCYTPPVNSWVWIFFDGGNVNKPFFWNAVEILPECVNNPGKKWVIFKSTSGNAMVISDDPDDARTEITGAKTLSKSPTGDEASVTGDAQSIILIDERAGQEKILIKTKGGNFINMSNDGNIEIKAAKKMIFEAGDDITFKTPGKFHVTAGDSLNLQGGSAANLKSNGSTKIEGGSAASITSGGATNVHGSTVGIKQGAPPADPAEAESANGDRTKE